MNRKKLFIDKAKIFFSGFGSYFSELWDSPGFDFQNDVTPCQHSMIKNVLKLDMIEDLSQGVNTTILKSKTHNFFWTEQQKVF